MARVIGLFGDVTTVAGAQPIRLGMIGCGLIARAHGRAAARSQGAVEFVACASRRLASARQWADTFGVSRAYDDITSMLRYERLDGVVISTWPADHRTHIDQCLDEGIRAILCEKALVTRAADALALWRRSRQLGATIVEGFMYRHHPALTQFRARVLTGEIGRLDSLHATFDLYDSEPTDLSVASWRQQSELGGGVPHDFLCYPVDAVGWLAGGLPRRVAAMGQRSERHGTIVRLFGTIEYDNGCIATVSSSRRAVFSQSLRAAGTLGELTLPVAWNILGDTALSLTRSPRFLHRETTQIDVTEQAHASELLDLPVFTRQLENFAAAILGREHPLMTMRESVINAIVLDALIESRERARFVDVHLPTEIAIESA